MALLGDKRKRAATRAQTRAQEKEEVERLIAENPEAKDIVHKSSNLDQKKLAKLHAKASSRHDKALLKLAELELARAQATKLISKRRVKLLFSVAQMLAPVVIPLGYRIATSVRAFYDNHQEAKAQLISAPNTTRADRLAALSERIEQTRSETVALSTQSKGVSKADPTAIATFRSHAETRLEELAEAVTTARRLSVPRRINAQRNIVRELDDLDTKLLEFRNVKL